MMNKVTLTALFAVMAFSAIPPTPLQARISALEECVTDTECEEAYIALYGFTAFSKESYNHER
jgi:hypothetical protein